jgi:3-methylcrotonyl-CoA carboxylase alpha subunit
VASGEKLPKTQDELSINGHAIEARLYAEDPAKGFLPSVGRLDHFQLSEPWPENAALYRIPRIDTGVEEGDQISPFYDPMIAKIIAWGEDRESAIQDLASYLDEAQVWPVRTNAGFLFNALLFPGFGTGEIDTGFIERHLDALVPDPEPDEALWRAAASVATAADEEIPLAGLVGFRLNGPEKASVVLGRAGEFRSVSLEDGDMAAASGFRDEERVVVFYEGSTFAFDRSSRGSVGAAAGDGAIISPMPGRVTAVEVAAGEAVVKGQRLLSLEAMKMEHGLVAPFDGVVAEVNAVAGLQVSEGAVLAKIEANAE